jgi:hypothetical protein
MSRRSRATMESSAIMHVEQGKRFFGPPWT